MHIPVELFILTAAILGSTIGFITAALLGIGKSRGQYTRGWNAGRNYTRNFPDAP